MIAVVVEQDATLVGALDPKHEKHPTMDPDEAVLLFYVVPVAATTRAKYPALQVIEVMVVNAVPVIEQAEI